MSANFADSVQRASGHIARAQTLFRDSFVLDCHEYMVEALQLQVQAWSELESDGGSESESESESDAGLARLERAGYRRVDRLRAALRATEAPANGAATDFDWIWAEVERLTRFSARHALTPRARKRRRILRIALAAGAVLLALFVAARLWGRPRVRASGIHSEPYAAANVNDGLEATEWLLPDGVAGSVDVLFPRARTVQRVHLLNAHNTFHADRAARAVRVTAFSKQGPVASKEGAFEAFSEARSELVLPLEARGVTRIRVEVLTYFKSGGGLAEVEVE